MVIGINAELTWLALHKAFSGRPRIVYKAGEVSQGEFEEVASLTEAQLEIAFGNDARQLRSALGSTNDVKTDWEKLRENSVQVVPFTDDQYPNKLKNIANQAPLIYAKGDLRFASRPASGICGSRKASGDGLKFAETFGALAADLKLVVVSGIAKGVDTSAHLGALEKGGTTIVVLAEGIEKFRWKRVFESVPDYHDRTLVISQFFPNHVWQVSRAMTRNATICALSEAVLVVEAGETGGTIAAGRECIRQNKPLLVVERSSDQNKAPGNSILINEGGIPVHDGAELRDTLKQLADGTFLVSGNVSRTSEPVTEERKPLERQLAFVDRQSRSA